MASSRIFSELRDVDNTASRKRQHGFKSSPTSPKRVKRVSAANASASLESHYATSFEDSQVPSQDWYNQEFGSNGVSDSPGKKECKSALGSLKSPSSNEVLKEIKHEDKELDSLKLIDNDTKAFLKLQTDLNLAESANRLLRAQLDSERADAARYERRSDNQLARLGLQLDEARVDKGIAEKLKEKKVEELQEAKQKYRVLERRVQQVEKERDSANAKKEEAEKKLKNLKVKLSSLVAV
ncbi:hypothetical protein V5O48_018741 [Marasmius crinis-equi]|uniref:Uncharacterized protein n=1 Tax=Marasmius crinis-equi TaxID=585013 RepID=A0ABR3EKB6_9AGAR